MNKKLFLLLGALLEISVVYSMELPCEQEVMATRNPLTIVLYALNANYVRNPVIPKGATFVERLENHILLKEKWLKSKGFFDDLQAAHQKGSSVEELKLAIEKNSIYQNFANFNMQITQKLLMASLLQAYKDCSDSSNSKP